MNLANIVQTIQLIIAPVVLVTASKIHGPVGAISIVNLTMFASEAPSAAPRELARVIGVSYSHDGEEGATNGEGDDQGR